MRELTTLKQAILARAAAARDDIRDIPDLEDGTLESALRDDGTDATSALKRRTKLLARVKWIRGQVEALEHALEGERGCSEVLQQIAAVRGTINGLAAQVMEDRLRAPSAGPKTTPQCRDSADELIELIRTYLK